MTKLNGLLASCALALVIAAPAMAQVAQQAPSQRVQRLPAQRVPAQVATTRPAPEPTTAVVAGNGGWQRTDITAHAGGQLTISATARWAVNRQQQSVARAAITGTDANGYPDTAGQGGTILPSANIGALIGKIGENGAPFLVGASYAAPARADGVLFLSMNDNADSFADNSGRLAVSATAAASPPREETPATSAPPATTTPSPNDVPTTTPPTDGAAPTDTATPADTTTQTTVSTDTTVTDQAGGRDNGSGGASSFLTPDVIRYGLIGAAVLAGLLLLSRLFSRPRSTRKSEHVTVPRVTARVSDDGIARQSLTIRGQ